MIRNLFVPVFNNMATSSSNNKALIPNVVGIIGSGIIGRNWAMIFASAGCRVKLFDKETSQVSSALQTIGHTLTDYEREGVLRGESSAEDQIGRVSGCMSLQACVDDADFIMECVTERLELKRSVFTMLDPCVKDDVIIASSASGLFPSALSEGLQHKSRLIVTHPLNPPYFIPFVEIVHAPWTDPDVIDRTERILKVIGQEPVVLKKEVPGFIICRVQHAITAECFKLVRDGVVNARDLDKLMPYGLGRRYAFLGPLEASYLNVYGMKDFCERYGEGLYELQQNFGPPIKLEGEVLDRVQSSIEEKIPLDDLDKWKLWRDKCLADLNKYLMKTSQPNKTD